MDSCGSSAATWFAPPERLDPEQIAREVAALGGLPGLRTVLDAVPHLVFLLNAERQILFGNRSARSLAEALHRRPFEGLRFGELLSCRNATEAPSGCGTGPHCHACGAVHAILAAVAGHAATHECRISSTDGEAYDLRLQASPFRLEEGDYVLVVVDDVSGEKRRAVLERVFFHDVLNTASGLCGIAGLIASDPKALPEFKEDLLATSELLVDEIRSQRLLLLAEANELEVHPAPISVPSLFEEVRALYRRHPAAPGRTIEIAVADPGLALVTDATILRRVLGNLVKNAIEASPEGARVTLGARATDGRLEFTCTNPGEIPPEVQRQLFQRNFSTKGAGRGIGTYSIRLLTERYLRGTVGFTSAPAQGTTFTVSLPRVLRPVREPDA